ncbi:hypothetical protein GA0111570_11480 [Raineyella antarctica]|uniref:DUF4143 domain-containing protein n=1 Tax=Raineyella antarctica TaxID=1577474 RepID=A0A1G6I811_9ACTN|nr:DUF4143 domain-containing protein [Raineyella antarctica]SDC02568.1 hypothetical protein GA0111570_11480 [Raineyella antarctica]
MSESLVTQSVRVYAQAADARLGHLRTRNTEHEVDLVVEAPDRSALAIEVKLADTVTSADVVHLTWLANQLGDRLVDRLVVYTGERAYRRDDGVGVVPLALLGPRPMHDAHSPGLLDSLGREDRRRLPLFAGASAVRGRSRLLSC